ncbi:MAG: ATP-binding protein [Pirellulales bacterium]
MSISKRPRRFAVDVEITKAFATSRHFARTSQGDMSHPADPFTADGRRRSACRHCNHRQRHLNAQVRQHAAQEAVRRRDEFLAMLSHELRNPLGAVLNATEVVAHRDGEPEATRQAFDVVNRQTRQMARLLDDLLDVSRITRGIIDIRPQVVDLAQLVREAIEVVQPKIDRRRHQLDVRIQHAPVWVEGDPSRLLQIQENLLTNAVKYTPTGGRIDVTLETDQQNVIITVKDNGHGIPRSMLSSIFDLFVQGDESLARSDGGMGVGLNLVKMLVEIHGGSISVYSDGPECGSEFKVRLPITSKLPQAEIVPEEHFDKYRRVLIIEDNDDSRQMLEALLRMDGYDVTVASNGITGVEAIRTHSPEVALIDIGLPGLDGYQVARRVRNELSNSTVKLVALTGYGRQSDRHAVMEAGFDEHLVKPVAPEDLARALQRRK